MFVDRFDCNKWRQLDWCFCWIFFYCVLVLDLINLNIGINSIFSLARCIFLFSLLLFFFVIFHKKLWVFNYWYFFLMCVISSYLFIYFGWFHVDFCDQFSNACGSIWVQQWRWLTLPLSLNFFITLQFQLL